MGGQGSGRIPEWHRDTCENSKHLDIRVLARWGVLKPGYRFPWSWTCRGEDAGSITLEVATPSAGDEAAMLSAFYNHRAPGAREWSPVVQQIMVRRTACTKGGSRPWFLCPGCSKRCAVLYLRDGYTEKGFRCRSCWRLPYAVQNESGYDRMLSAAWKIRRRLGQQCGGHDDLFPPKPKGMHTRTYDRLCRKAEEAERGSWGALLERFSL